MYNIIDYPLLYSDMRVFPVTCAHPCAIARPLRRPVDSEHNVSIK